MKPFPFALYPLYKKREDWSALATTGFDEEASRPHYKGTIARLARDGEQPDFTEDGIGYMWPEGESRPDLSRVLPVRGNIDTKGIRSLAQSYGPWIYSEGIPQFAHTILPRSLRRFLQQRGYSDKKIDDIIADNYTAHQTDMADAKSRGIDPDKIYRRPVYLFSPEARAVLLKHLNQTSDVFDEGGTKTPLEHTASLIGSMSIDPETGTPFIHVRKAIPAKSDNNTTTSSQPVGNNHKRQVFDEKLPHEFTIGDAHSHPPTATSYMSREDMLSGLQNGFVNPYNLQIVHSAGTIHTPGDPNALGHEFRAGADAEAYLRDNGFESEIINGRRVRTGFRGYRISTTQGAGTTHTAFMSGYHGAVAPESKPNWWEYQYDPNLTPQENDLMEAEHRQRKMYAAHEATDMGYRPVTSAQPRIGMGVVSFPTQVQFLGQNLDPHYLGSIARQHFYQTPWTSTGQRAEDANRFWYARVTQAPYSEMLSPNSDEMIQMSEEWRQGLADAPYRTSIGRGSPERYSGGPVPPQMRQLPLPSPSRARDRVEQGGTTPEQQQIVERIRAGRRSGPTSTMSVHTKAFPFAVYPHEVLYKGERYGEGLPYYREHEPESIEASMEPGKIYGIYIDSDGKDKAIHIDDPETLYHWRNNRNKLDLKGFFGEKGLLQFTGSMDPMDEAVGYHPKPGGGTMLVRKKILDPRRNLHINWLEAGTDESGQIGTDRIDHPNTQRQLFDALHAAGIKTITSEPTSFSRAKLFAKITDKFHNESGGLHHEPTNIVEKDDFYI